MKKLLLPVLLACAALVAGCGDRTEYAAHRAERSKPKVEVSEGAVAIRRAPYPNLEIRPNGHLRLDDIELPLKEEQHALLRESFATLQVLRQNTLIDLGEEDAGKRSVPLQVPPGVEPFPADLADHIPEFRQYDEALTNLRAVR